MNQPSMPHSQKEIKSMELTANSAAIRKTASVLKYLRHFLIGISLLTLGIVCALSQQVHPHSGVQTQSKADPGALIQIVRESTERFKDVKVAEGEGYALMFGCVTGPDAGAMGLHYVNGQILSQNLLDPTKPTIVIYEPQPDGALRLIGADFVVFADAWDKKNQGPPQLMGQLFHYFEAPNRFGLPPFYTLHVWAWKENPNGAFVNWHPNVSCQHFSGQ
jgi:hypothetical protein